MSRIRLVVVDDSLFFRTFLVRNLGKDSSIEIVGNFGDPVEASRHIHELRPDVIALDMEMPRMRGDQFLREVMPNHPNVKAVVISALSGNVFDAMQAGAIDFVGKPGSTQGYDEKQFITDIIEKIKIASRATTRRASPRQVTRDTGVHVSKVSVGGVSNKSVIAIGASTGGTEAIIEVIKKLPANAPPVVIVQHMPAGFTRMYAERVDKICAMNVIEARNGDRAERGRALIAPGGDSHMYLNEDSKGLYVSIKPGAKVSSHCPSVDVLFDSVAKVAGRNAVAVLLTGMGADGAEGMVKIKASGGFTIGQNQETCVVYGMPMEAYKRGGVSQQLKLQAIGDAVLRRFQR